MIFRFQELTLHFRQIHVEDSRDAGRTAEVHSLLFERYQSTGILFYLFMPIFYTRKQEMGNIRRY